MTHYPRSYYLKLNNRIEPNRISSDINDYKVQQYTMDLSNIFTAIYCEKKYRGNCIILSDSRIDKIFIENKMKSHYKVSFVSSAAIDSIIDMITKGDINVSSHNIIFIDLHIKNISRLLPHISNMYRVGIITSIDTLSREVGDEQSSSLPTNVDELLYRPITSTDIRRVVKKVRL